MIKIFLGFGIEGNFFNLISHSYKTTVAHITVKGSYSILSI